MAPVMWALWRLVLSADRLYAWHYSENYLPPTQADYAYAAIVFWGALLTPVTVGLVMAVVTFRREGTARWPIAETCIVAVPLLALSSGLVHPLADDTWLGNLLLGVLLWANFVVGGVVVTALLNLGACLRHRGWGRLALSALVSCGGTVYLLWLYAFIIYIDT